MTPAEEETWRLTVDARLSALEAALAALAVIKGDKARRALAAALDKAAESTPPERDPAYHAAMQVALRSLADSLRLPEQGAADA